QPFFDRVTKCWMPTGQCVDNMPTMTAVNACWASGAQFIAALDTMTMKAHGSWQTKQGAVCMTADVTPSGNDAVFIFTVGKQMLTFIESTGDVVCPDGTKVTIGPNFGSCGALKDLINVPMQNCTEGP